MGLKESQTDCPDAESLAALAEGKVSGQERRTLIHHLRDCRDCFDVYQTALHSVDDEDLSHASPGLALFPLAWVAMAAAIVAAVAVGIFLRSQPGPQQPRDSGSSLWASTRKLASTASATHGDLPPLVVWRRNAGGYAFASNDPARAARRLGVRLADLDWALGLRSDATSLATSALKGELADLGRSATAEKLAALRLGNPQQARQLELIVLPESSEREAAALGWGLEWCRLATRAGRADLCPHLGAPPWSSVKTTLDDPAARTLWEEIAAQLAKTEQLDLPLLEERLTRLLEVLT